MTKTQSNNESIVQYLKHFDFIFDTTHTAILVEDTHQNVLLSNQNFHELFHINSSQNHVIGKPSAAIFNQISNDTIEPRFFNESVQKFIEKNKIKQHRKFQFKNNDSFNLSYFPYFKENTQIGNIWVFSPEAKHFKFLQTPVNKPSIVETALHCLSNEIAIYNKDAQIEFINKAYIPSEEKRNWAKGKTVEQYFSYENLLQESTRVRQENIDACLKFRKTFSWQEKNNKNQEYNQRSVYPILVDGNLEGAIEFSCNISKQKKLEKQLEHSVEIFYNVINSVDNLIFTTDNKLKISQVNNFWNSFSSSKSNHAVGKSIFDVLEITNYDLYEKAFAVLNGKTQNEQGIVSLKDKNGKIKQFEYNLFSCFNVDVEEKGILATLKDVTKEKMQEAQLLELIKKEKELNELKTAFVNMVSHELRTPLTVISSSAEILELLLQQGKGFDDVNAYTQQIISEVEKMTSFMQDLLMISKIEAGKISIKTQKTNVVNFVNRTVNSGFLPWKDGRKTNVIFKRNAQDANIDAGLLEHSIHNLLTNAFKYSGGKTDPTIRTSFSKNYFTISIIDYGIGIPSEEYSKLFTSFHRAKNTGNISGTGIGLMVAKYFTEQHKGSIHFKSKENVGSIFSLKIPYTA